MPIADALGFTDDKIDVLVKVLATGAAIAASVACHVCRFPILPLIMRWR
jgi:hypothetical protein